VLLLFARDIGDGRTDVCRRGVAGMAAGCRAGRGGFAGRKRRNSDACFLVVIRPVEPWVETLGRRGSDSGSRGSNRGLRIVSISPPSVSSSLSSYDSSLTLSIGVGSLMVSTPSCCDFSSSACAAAKPL
jgi:hypothetical protein